MFFFMFPFMVQQFTTHWFIRFTSSPVQPVYHCLTIPTFQFSITFAFKESKSNLESLEDKVDRAIIDRIQTTELTELAEVEVPPAAAAATTAV